MSDINNINNGITKGIGGALPVSRLPQARVAYQAETSTPQPARSADKVELSPQVQALLEKLRAGDVRQDKVQDVRAQLAEGTYETDDKLNTAIDRLIDDLTA